MLEFMYEKGNAVVQDYETAMASFMTGEVMHVNGGSNFG